MFKDFGKYAKRVSEEIKDNARELSDKELRPLIHLDSSRTSKEDIARKIQEEEQVREGLICVLKGVEPCISFDTRGNRETGKLEVVIRERKCLFLYFYYQHKEFGFMHVRIQMWFPFQIQIYINGREWLCKRLDSKGIGYRRYDNSIMQVDDVKRAMGKSVFNLYRYAEVSKSANERYLGALSAVVPLHDCVKELEQLAQPVHDGQNRHSGFNPLSPEVTRVFEAVLDGAHSINGFRNKDLRNQLFSDNTRSPEEMKKTGSKITRIIRKLRAHRLISKIPRSTRYKVTEKDIVFWAHPFG